MLENFTEFNFFFVTSLYIILKLFKAILEKYAATTTPMWTLEGILGKLFTPWDGEKIYI